MKIFPLPTAPRVPIPIDARILFSSGRYEMVHLALQPGEGMAPHVMPFDVVFFVVEGTGSLLAGEEEVSVPEDTAEILPRRREGAKKEKSR